MNLASKNNERLIADRRGEPPVVIMSVQDFIRTALPPYWLEKACVPPSGAGSTHSATPLSTPGPLRTGVAVRTQSPLPGRSDAGWQRSPYISG
jgi:hypothetical protein